MKPIGVLIRDELRAQERTVSWLARELSCDRSNIYRIFNRHSFDTDTLARISVILNHDFFSDLSDGIKSRMP